MHSFFLRCTTLAAIGCVAMLAGCAPGEKTLGEADAKIQALSASGCPDSMLSSARVFLSQARASKKIGNSGLAAGNFDSCKSYITMAETWMSNAKTKIKPQVDSLKAAVNSQKKELAGAQLQHADSLLAIVDSLLGKNQLPEALAQAQDLVAFMPTLLADEKKSTDIKSKLPGTWVGERSPETKGMNAVEKRTITFKGDGTFQSDESMKGQTAENLKEDWQFISNGTWIAKGDTILLMVNHEKCLRQNYSRMIEQGGKKKWVDNPGKTYDSTVTNHSKDKFLTWDYIKEYFKKK
jgi:hypothetical protein